MFRTARGLRLHASVKVSGSNQAENSRGGSYREEKIKGLRFGSWINLAPFGGLVLFRERSKTASQND